MNVTGPRGWYVNLGSGNGLLSSSLDELVLSIQLSFWLTSVIFNPIRVLPAHIMVTFLELIQFPPEPEANLIKLSLVMVLEYIYILIFTNMLSADDQMVTCIWLSDRSLFTFTKAMPMVFWILKWWKDYSPGKYLLHTWQPSVQHSCSDICEIWIHYNGSILCLCKWRIIMLHR